MHPMSGIICRPASARLGVFPTVGVKSRVQIGPTTSGQVFVRCSGFSVEQLCPA